MLQIKKLKFKEISKFAQSYIARWDRDSKPVLSESISQ